MIVADTCIIFALFNQTFITERAQEVLEKDSSWIFPTLWREEYANVLSKLCRKEHRNIEEVINHFNTTLASIQKCEVPVDVSNALEISIQYKISVYDAHFVSLALEYDIPLVTEDKEVLKKCSGIALNMNGFLR